MSSEARGEDGEVADKGWRSFRRGQKDNAGMTRKVLAVNVYLVCNSNDYGRY